MRVKAFSEICWWIICQALSKRNSCDKQEAVPDLGYQNSFIALELWNGKYLCVKEHDMTLQSLLNNDGSLVVEIHMMDLEGHVH